MTNARYRRTPLLPTAHEMTHLDLEVVGTLPDELDGTYLRNGPNQLGPIPDNLHYFSGHGMVHGVRLRGGRALWYRNRFVRSGDVPALLGERDPGGPVANDMDVSPNVNVIRFGDRVFATTEGGPNLVELDPQLGSVARSDLDGALAFGFTGHHKTDPATGEIHAVAYGMALEGHALYLRLAPDGRRLHQVRIPLTGASQIHDMAITARHALIFDLNVVFDPALLDRTTLPIRWASDKPSRIGVLPHDGGADDVRWFTVDPCYVYHPVNAFERDGDIVVDVSRYPKAAEKDLFGPLGDSVPTIDRWVLPVASGGDRAHESRLSALPLDFPKVSPRVEGRPYRYAYTVEATLKPSFEGAYKLDVETGDALHQALDGGNASELTFIPRASATAEDDGWLIGFVYQPEQERSRLVVLDAQRFDEAPVASVWIPERHVPIGTHGGWFPGWGR